MITPFDDYPIHQAAAPLAAPASTDRNFYDRYWFDGFDRDGGVLFEIGFGIYPNRYVQDAHFSVSMDGKQVAFHASRRAPLDRTDTTVGPMRIEIVKPMRVIRVVVEPNETGIACDLTFRARSAPHQEERNLMNDGVRVIMDTVRFTQFGAWEGWFEAKGKRHELALDRTLGQRDRSWGVRPVGEMELGAPSKLTTDPSVYWVWSPIFFPDGGLHFATREDPEGNPAQLAATWLPLYAHESEIPEGAPVGEIRFSDPSHRIVWEKGTRRLSSAVVGFERDGKRVEVTMEPRTRFQMTGLGYQNSEWGHAVWHDELAIGSEEWDLAEVDPEDYSMIHTHHVVRATMGEVSGVGIFETVCFGRHAPSGFEDFFDGAK